MQCLHQHRFPKFDWSRYFLQSVWKRVLGLFGCARW